MKTIILQKSLITIIYAIFVLLFVGLNSNITSAEETSSPLRNARLLEGEQLTDEEKARRRARREARLLEEQKLIDREELTDEEIERRKARREARLLEEQKFIKGESLTDKKEELTEDTRTIQITDNDIKPRISEVERTRLKALAREKRIGEIAPIRKERMQIRRDEIRTKFEETKNVILDKSKKWEITREDARKLIFQAREDIIVKAKKEILQEKKEIQQENLNRLKSIIQTKLESKLSQVNTLSTDDQAIVYQKLIDKIDLKLSSTSLSKKKNILMNIIKDILVAKKSTLN